MKKSIIILTLLVLAVGCASTQKTPVTEVDRLIKKYGKPITTHPVKNFGHVHGWVYNVSRNGGTFLFVVVNKEKEVICKLKKSLTLEEMQDQSNAADLVIELMKTCDETKLKQELIKRMKED